jgi:hypothetical protein
MWEPRRLRTLWAFTACFFFLFNSHRRGGGSPVRSTRHSGNWLAYCIDYDDGEFGGMKIGRENWSTRRKPIPAPLCPPQIPLDQTRDRTRAAAVGSQRLTAWAMARPREYHENESYWENHNFDTTLHVKYLFVFRLRMKCKERTHNGRSCLPIYLSVRMFRLKTERIFFRIFIGLYDKCGLESLILVLCGNYNVIPPLREAESGVTGVDFLKNVSLYRVRQHNFLFSKLNKTHCTNQNIFICFL